MQFKKALQEIRLILGIPSNTSSAFEKFISAVGATCGILAVACLTAEFYLGDQFDHFGYAMVVTSMGASAVLLFAVPHGALSQPWAVLGGNVLSAAIGVTCFKVFGGTPVAAALAVGVAVGAMYTLRCIHPPGGATALTAVIGGESVTELGYLYLLTPVLLNVCTILVIAVLFNCCFHWRRYPAHLYFKRMQYSTNAGGRQFELSQEDLSAALQQHNSFTDITEEGLNDLLELAKQHADSTELHPAKIQAGRFYSNGRLGKFWSVRQVTGISSARTLLRSTETIVFQVVAGEDKNNDGSCSLADFVEWARFEVVQKEGRWVKIDVS